MKNKKSSILFIIIAFTALVINVFGQNTSYPFEVRKTGSGKQAIIFVPGFASSGDVWNGTLATYEKKYTCYTLTMAGFAGAPAQPKPTFSGWETGIAAFIRQNKIDKPIIIGHSMGGVMAMALAADYPEFISKIVVVDGLPCLGALMNPSYKVKEHNDCGEMGSKMASMANDEFYQMQKKTIPMLLADTSKQELVISWSVKSDRTTFGEMYCDFSNTDLREKIATIKCPSLVLLESYFANLKPAIEEQFRNMHRADIRFSTKGLHFIMYDDTEWYNQQLSTFLK